MSIPKTQTAVVFEAHNGPLFVRHDHPVVQQKDLKPGEALVKIEVRLPHTSDRPWLILVASVHRCLPH